jgi:hypothetical protein
MCKSYQDIQCLTALVQQIVNNYLATGAPLVLKGVTDASDAAPGIVGEFVQIITPFTVPTGSGNQVISAGTLQPGDWDIWGAVGINAAVTLVEGYLDPQPTGVSNNMGSVMEISAGAGSGVFGVNLLGARASLSVATPFVVRVITTASASGNGNVYFIARRVR